LSSALLRNVTKRDRLQVLPLSHRFEEAQSQKLKWHRVRLKHRGNVSLQESSSSQTSDTTTAAVGNDTADRILSRVSKNLNVIQQYLPKSQQWSDLRTNVFSYMNPRLRNRVGPTMDRQWWFYHIGLALSPAVCIALLCEYYQEEMNDFYKEQQERETRRFHLMMGEGTDVVEGGLIPAAAVSSSNHKPTVHGYPTIANPSMMESLGMTRLLDSCPHWLQQFLHTIYQTINPASVEYGDDHKDEPIHTESLQVFRNSKDLSHPTSSLPPTPSPSQTLITETMNTSPATLESLLERIQHLETIIDSQQQQQREKVIQQRMDYQIQRKLNQSGIRNRLEDKLLNERIQQQQQEMQTSSRNSSTSPSSASTITTTTSSLHRNMDSSTTFPSPNTVVTQVSTHIHTDEPKLDTANHIEADGERLSSSTNTSASTTFTSSIYKNMMQYTQRLWRSREE
jgi:hypothetical protein